MAELSYLCVRARAYASHKLDDELSELESRLLERHLAECTTCASFADDIAESTALLRASDLEQCSVEIRPMRRHSHGAVRRAAVVSSGLFVAAALLGVVASIQPSTTLSPPEDVTTNVDTPAIHEPDGHRGIPIVTRTLLPLGQLKAVDDF